MSSAVGVAGLKAGEAFSSVNISVCLRPSQITEAGGQKHEGKRFSLHVSSLSSCWWFVALGALQKNVPLLFGIVFLFSKNLETS